MSTICPLFSGSTGNSTYIGTKEGAILIDAGASMKSLIAACERVGGSFDQIKAIAVTHEHTDHIIGLKAVLRNTKATLVASSKTLEALIAADKIPVGTNTFTLDNGGFSLGSLYLTRFATSHDCEGSSGYTISTPDNKKISVCTDLGIVTDEVRNALSGSDAVLIESNHDVEMLKKGPYPPQLKLRIMSEKGHISNLACAAELGELLKSGTTRFILGHLSQKNNTPLLARSSAEAALIDLGAENGKDYILSVASPKINGVTVL